MTSTATISLLRGKHILCTLLHLFLLNQIAAQIKSDYIWLLGDDQQVGSEVRALKFDFNKTPFSPELRDKGLNFDRNNVSICDENGALLFYSNGCAIANKDHEVMMNGDSINSGEFLELAWGGGGCSFGYPGRQDIQILKDPNYSKGYYVFHKRIDLTNENEFRILNLSYSYVDMNLDEGLGAVTEKNIDFYSLDEFLWSYLTAIYQENGNDWWIVNPGSDNKFYLFSLDDQGLIFSHAQEAMHEFHPINASASGDAKFSPDGSQFAYFNQYDGLLLYNFDRQTGKFSNLRKLPFQIPSQAAFATCEWSSNSEFLYLATQDSLWQVEVGYDNLEEGKVFIDAHNGVQDPFSTRFFISTLGPDCRIYIRPGSSSYSFHVINNPNLKGQACDFVQQGIKLPEISSTGSFPNYPRFRVDEEEKCDPSIVSMFGELVYYRRDLDVYPNPCIDKINVNLPENMKGNLFVYSLEGRVVWQEKVDNRSRRKIIDMTNYASGMYNVEFIPDSKERILFSKQIVKTD